MTMDALNNLSKTLLPEIEKDLKQVVSKVNRAETKELHDMLAYHMGWVEKGNSPSSSGKRIRPLLVLLTTGAAGGEWKSALPAASAVELLHNFSLIHDDIEDNSPLRRGRPTLWKRWGIPQAINCGDTMFTLANLAVLRLEETSDLSTVIHVVRALQETCLELTAGQYLDLAYESRSDLSLEDYWTMIGGKTASLLGTCTLSGALIAGCDLPTQNAYHEFGISLGLAFQVQDDFLGIWGDAHLTGKSADSDLVTGKKSLPVLFGLSKEGEFAQRWAQGPITAQEVPEIASQLEMAGAKDYTNERASFYTEKALTSLENAKPRGEFGEALGDLADYLLKRDI